MTASRLDSVPADPQGGILENQRMAANNVVRLGPGTAPKLLTDPVAAAKKPSVLLAAHCQ